MAIIPIDQLPDGNSQSKGNIIPIEQLPESSEGFSQPQFEAPQQESSPLNGFQQLVLSLAPDNNTKMRYLAEKFIGSEVDQDNQGNLRINGRRVNPQGFQFGADILGNAGTALPIAGQITGGILGGTAGATAGGIGAVPGAIGGGVAGAAAGKALQTGLGAAFGQRPSLESTVGGVAGESALALGGELATRGIIAGARAGAKISGADKAIANAWRTALTRLGKYAPEVAEFVGGVNKDAVRTGQKFKFNEMLRDEYFSEDKMQRIVKNTLFGNESEDLLRLASTDPALNGLQKGTVKLAENIKAVDNSAYDALVNRYADISQDTISTIKSSAPREIFNASNLADDRGFKLASRFEDLAQSKLNVLGKDLEQSRLSAIASSRYKYMPVNDLGNELDAIIKDVRGGIRVPGFRSPGSYNIPGLNELEAMKRSLGGLVEDNKGNRVFKFFGDQIKNKDGKLTTLPNPSLKQLTKKLTSIDDLADSLFKNKSAPTRIKIAARDWLRKIRGRYDSMLGLTDKNAVYSAFKDVTNSANLDRATFLAQFEGQIKNFRKISGAQKNTFNAVLDNLNSDDARKLLKDIDLLNAADELRKVNIQKVTSSLESSLNSKNMLNSLKYGVEEATLKQIDSVLRNSGRAATKVAFMDDVEKTLGAREFLKGTPNLLRIGAVLRLGGLGFLAGGPAGALAGATIAQPRNVGRILSALERGVRIPQPVQSGLQRVGQAVPAEASQILAGLLRSQDQSMQSQQ